MALPAEKGRYTFADCLNWGEKERAELIGGEIVMMARRHGFTKKSAGSCSGSSPTSWRGRNARSTLLPSLCAYLRKAGTPQRTWTQW